MLEKKKRIISRTDNGFAFLDVGSEEHNRNSFRIWVSDKLIQKDDEIEYIEFPIRGTIIETERGNYVLKSHHNIYTYDVFIKSGYRGESNIQVEKTYEKCIFYKKYASPLGNLGISIGALISTNKDCEIKWSKTGRLYGAPDHGRYRINAKKQTVESIIDDDDAQLCNILNE